jgi:hypothetical protein
VPGTTVERVRVGTSDLLHRMCARCRFECRSEEILGTLEGLWSELWRRIEAEDPHRLPKSSTATF